LTTILAIATTGFSVYPKGGSTLSPKSTLVGEGISLVMSSNGGAAGVTLPAPLDESEALQLELYDESG